MSTHLGGLGCSRHDYLSVPDVSREVPLGCGAVNVPPTRPRSQHAPFAVGHRLARQCQVSNLLRPSFSTPIARSTAYRLFPSPRCRVSGQVKLYLVDIHTFPDKICAPI